MEAEVRILLMRTVPTFNNASQTSSVEIVLMNEFGGQIQAIVHKTLVYKFLPMSERTAHGAGEWVSSNPQTSAYMWTSRMQPISCRVISRGRTRSDTMQKRWCCCEDGVSV